MTARSFDDAWDCTERKLYSFICGGFLNRPSGIVFGQCSDFMGTQKAARCMTFASPILARSWRSPAPTKIIGNRSWLALCNAVARAASSSAFTYCSSSTKSATQVFFRSRRFSNLLSAKIGGSGLQISVVCQTGFRLDVQPNLNILVLYPQSTYKSCQRPQSALWPDVWLPHG